MKKLIFAFALLLVSFGCSNPEVTEKSSIPNEVAIKMQDSTELGEPYYLIKTTNYDYYIKIEKEIPVVKKSYPNDSPYWAFLFFGIIVGFLIGLKIADL